MDNEPIIRNESNKYRQASILFADSVHDRVAARASFDSPTFRFPSFFDLEAFLDLSDYFGTNG